MAARSFLILIDMVFCHPLLSKSARGCFKKSENSFQKRKYGANEVGFCRAATKQARAERAIGKGWIAAIHCAALRGATCRSATSSTSWAARAVLPRRGSRLQARPDLNTLRGVNPHSRRRDR